ncbi:cellulose synthase operon protein YhjQ/BcsQ [Sandarakinorhabdus sp.]|uniref:AAA family ATPase n=1 Tax=Sandarakinorhabdus sp. TaxID=1916663 RepID=UPI00333EE760
MNAITPITPGGDGDRLQSVLAYVSDADSEAALKRVAAHLALPGFEVRRGDITTASRDLRQQRSPALLLVDITGIDRVLDAVQALSDVCEPQMQVVVIGDVNDVGLFRGLLRLGVTDYLFKPLTAELLEQLIWRLMGGSSRDGEARLGKLVAVTGARGGVGTSSIAANLASYLAEKAGRRVVLIDMDVNCGALALMTGVKPNAGLADALEAPGRVDDLFLERATINVGNRLDLMASELPPGRDVPITAEAAEVLLSRLQRVYHYVIADIPQSVLARCQPLLANANMQVLVSEATLLAARDTAARQDSASLFTQRQILVHNSAGRPGDLSDADYVSALKRAPDLAVPWLPRTFGQAINLGQPACLEDSKAEAAIALLAREISGQSVGAETPPSWKDRAARLLGLTA